MVYKLKEPVHVGTETITELTFKPFKAKYLRTLSEKGSDVARSLELAGKLTGQTTVVIDELCAEDTAEVLKIVGNFLSPFRGATGSES